MKAIIAASMTVLLAQGVAMAKPAAKAAAPHATTASAEALDLDKDGKLSKEEVKGDAALSAKFDELDANKDGFLEKAELGAHAAKTEVKKAK